MEVSNTVGVRDRRVGGDWVHRFRRRRSRQAEGQSEQHTVMPRAGRDKLTARLTGPRLEPGQACPVTRPSDRSEQPPAQLRELVHDGVRAAYGRGPLWVVLPRADEAGVNSARDPGGRIGTKVAWYVGVQGPLRVVARRLDTDSTMTGHAEIADPGTLPYRMEPTRLDLPAQGAGGWLGASVETS